MLPNWLYGKSKSKLASILGGGGGIPEDYNQVKAQVTQNAEDILALSDALDGKAALTQITNPNLLDNSWFTINQRSVTTLTSGGKLADRWSITGNGTWEASISSDGIITIDNSENTNTIYFIQKMPSDFFTKLGSKPLTASLMFSDGTIVHGSKQDATGTVYYDDDNISITRNYQNEVININIKAGATISIRAIKLELGSISTLAMDIAPNYETELAKCQRYFQRIAPGTSNIWLAMGNGYNGNANFVIPIAPMRANPTLTYANVTLASVQTTSVAIISKTGERYDALRSRCHLTLTYDPASFTENELPLGIYAAVNSGSYLDFDAEL